MYLSISHLLNPGFILYLSIDSFWQPQTANRKPKTNVKRETINVKRPYFFCSNNLSFGTTTTFVPSLRVLLITL